MAAFGISLVTANTSEENPASNPSAFVTSFRQPFSLKVPKVTTGKTRSLPYFSYKKFKVCSSVPLSKSISISGVAFLSGFKKRSK
ncbi:MAG: hypothetical protein BWY47_01563 [Bacteroidetes bacterium ADurb.Bin302]|nr:MAG: hypothetical protein BWY47_01563 [Bacteroidetes bacterium ADurb.Bin302]